ncbi:MAG: DUF202 domain-containing protein [Acidithiobacillus sp.]
MHVPRFKHLDAHRQRFHRYPKGKYIIRDWLAHDRTAAANKRTLYSSLRTTLDLGIAGLILVRFFHHPAIIALGLLFLILSPTALFYGLYRYRKVQSHYRMLSAVSRDFLPSALRKAS